MSRARLGSTQNPVNSTSSLSTPELREEPGLSGPYSTNPVVGFGDEEHVILQGLLERAREIRPLLRERQARTEEEGTYSSEVHDFFLEHGFYRVLQPKKFGGLELGVAAFFQVVAEVGRGCPSTAWSLALSVAHSLTLSSYWGEQAQQEVFEKRGYMIAPSSGNPTATKIERVEGGFLVSGKWRYCSGAPYSTHFFPTAIVPGVDGDADYQAWICVDREDYEVLDDWGRVIGMRGSGSNGITMEDVFVPEHRVCREDWTSEISGPTPGYLIHGNPVFNGTFFGFAEGEVAAAQLGLGYAFLDEFERIIRTSKAPYDSAGGLRADDPNWRRIFGTALAKVDAAAAALFYDGHLYREYARQAVAGEAVFDAARSLRLNNSYFMVEELVWEAAQEMVRAAGTSAQMDGARLQRLFRDAWTTVTRTDQLPFFAAPAAGFYFEGPGDLG